MKAARLRRWSRSYGNVSLRVVVICAMVSQSMVAMANPYGGVVVDGSATISGGGPLLTINQGTDRAVIDWQSFSINPGEVTQFNVPNANSATLNRVISGAPSSLLGQLQSNGQVFLINPNGIFVGPNAQIDVGGLTASTLDIANSNFMAGGDLHFSGDSNAAIINYGNMRAIGGNIFLIGANVENHGVIQAADGTVGIAAGQSVTLVDAERPYLVVQATADSISDTGVVNSGLIEAAQVELAVHGNVYALAINNRGTVRATGAEITDEGRVILRANGGLIENTGDLVAQNGDGTGGQVTIDAIGGAAHVSGSIDVSGDVGGSVQILASDIQLAGVDIDASGANGGGVVNVGGNYQGRGPLPNAETVSVDAATSINVDASASGNGGSAIIWSDDTTDFAGSISGRGGAASGNGGFAEVSGKLTLDYTGLVDLSAAHGATGTLLLDPTNITIALAQAAAISNALNSANVVVSTSSAGGQDGNIRVNSPIVKETDNSLAFLAHGDIRFNDNVQLDGTGSFTAVAGWDGSTGFGGGAGLQPGTVDFDAIINGDAFGGAKLNGGFGSIFVGNTAQTSGIAVGAADSNMTTNIAGYNVEVLGSNTLDDAYAQIGFHSTSSDPTESINNSINVYAQNNVIVRAGSAIDSYAMIGNGGPDYLGEAMGDITIRARNGVRVETQNIGDDDQFAQIGHWARYVDADIDVRTRGPVAVLSPGGNTPDDGQARIGHYGMFDEDFLEGEDFDDDLFVLLKGDITVDSNDWVAVRAGGNGNVAQIGHEGMMYFFGDEHDTDGDVLPLVLIKGDIRVRAEGQNDMTSQGLFVEGTGDESYAQIGHHGLLEDDSFGDGARLRLRSGRRVRSADRRGVEPGTDRRHLWRYHHPQHLRHAARSARRCELGADRQPRQPHPVWRRRLPLPRTGSQRQRLWQLRAG